MHNLLLEHIDVYNDSIKEKKASVCEVVLAELKQHGCRFLTTANDCHGYVECTESQAITKIMHGFRNLRQKQQREKLKQMKSQQQEQEQETNGSTTTANKKRNLEE